MKNHFDIVGKSVLITGGSGVLGSAMATSLCESGARVALLSRDADELELTGANLNRQGHSVLTLLADVLKEDQLIQARTEFKAKLGPLDILINAAGGNQKGATISTHQSILDIDISAIRSVVDLNLIGSLLPVQIFGRDFIEKKSGVIINISSMSAFRPLTRVAGYSASKAAISNLTQWLAVELAQKYGEGIRVNAIAPGFFLTEQNRELLTHTDGSLTERGQRIIDHTPFARFGNPDDLIGTMLWLCSDASRFVTGTVIPVDGGFNAYGGV